ncbi:PucR family transcriptional regulator [Saccharopolyspora pogona]|uniref:PucR family transcriptional regulator n=1 Tax=Saccharopolyspora pogona TaxID=333966 RepID=UPI0016880270|nr:helix-turn-helix domain-containing protein [Saccharopolyspora pogona]
MADVESGVTLGDLFGSDAAAGRLLQPAESNFGRVITRAQLMAGGHVGTVPDSTLLVHVGGAGESPYLEEIARIFALPGSLVVCLWPPDAISDNQLVEAAGEHLVVRAGAGSDPASVIAEFARATRPPDQAMTRRLTALQRSLTQTLAEPEPLKALTHRLAKTCNAVTAVVKANGELEAASGPLPLTRLMSELRDDFGESHILTVNGWHGMCVRIAGEDSRAGWLIVASRRDAFPEPYATAAAHVAASLAETHIRVDLLARRQDRAVRGALLEQILSLQLERRDTELEGRAAALGISFTDESRVIIVSLLRGQQRSHGVATVEAMYNRLDLELTALGTPHLLALRDGAIVGLVQASGPTIQRIFNKINSSLRGFLLGIGRRTSSIGEAVDSYHDAHLAVRTLRAPGRTGTSMSYEDFDFATRLFSDVGVERMSKWAAEMLQPLAEQQILLDGLRAYFEHEFNIVSAARALKIHHNSLRYRLSRAEDLLGLNLKDPAAVSSLFLALTAMAMASWTQAPRRPDRSDREPRPGPSFASDTDTDFRGEQNRGGLTRGLGVAFGPER